MGKRSDLSTLPSIDFIRSIADRSADGMVIVDCNRQIIFANRSFQRQTGLTRSRFRVLMAQGLSCCSQLRLSCCRSGCMAQSCIEAAFPMRLDEIDGADLSGAKGVFVVHFVPLKNQRQQTIAVLMTIRDVTAEERIQARYKFFLQKAKDQQAALARAVDERTLELRQTQTQLVQAAKMASLGQLIAGIAHELNNPINFIYANVDPLAGYLNAIQQLIEGVLHLGLSPEQQSKWQRRLDQADATYLMQDLRKIARSFSEGAERVKTIVDDLLIFAHQKREPAERVDIHAELERAIQFVHHRRGSIALLKCYANEPLAVLGYANELNQVWANLLTNALQAVDPAGGRVTISTGREAGFIVVRISDNGVGIAPEIRDRIFDPFFTTKSVGRGTGLGLTICYQIIAERHRGTIALENGPNGGTDAIVRLPAIAA